MSEAVLDASALLALIGAEPGSGVVAEALPTAVMSAVNYSEVSAKLIDLGLPEAEARRLLQDAPLEVAAFDKQRATEAGFLRSVTRDAGLSLGDRACLGLALEMKLPVLTADGAWRRLTIGVDVQLIR